MENLSFDFIIIGSGSAGSSLAHRLSENKNITVAILEYGGNDLSPLVQMPSALSYPMNMKKYDWEYYTEPEPYLDGRTLKCPRGKIIGGSSSINGMIYVRGNAKDYDYWEECGAYGWGFSDVLPYFKKMENAAFGENEWRGKEGPMYISRGLRNNPLHKSFLGAIQEAGYNFTEDYNGFMQEGFGAADMTVRKGRRWSTANAYLKPALKNTNLKLFKNTLVNKIIFQNNIAIGISCIVNGIERNIYANREVICCAGSINSPQIFQRSGIGNAKFLKQHNINLIKNLPGVGENLQDHLEIYFQVESLKPITLYKHNNLLSKFLIGFQWLLFKKGLGATNHFETLGFIRSKKGVSYPNIQFHLLPIAINYDGSSPVNKHGFQLHVGPMRSKSRGTIKIRDKNPLTAPKILFNYMSYNEDWEDFRICIKLTREILKQKSLKNICGEEIQPGKNIINNDQMDAFIKKNVVSAYHPCGTMKMGRKDDPLAVVDNNCKVFGIENLRVVDSSIFPIITNGNLNAPSIMAGEKAADIILGKQPLPKSNEVPYTNPNWKLSQK